MSKVKLTHSLESFPLPNYRQSHLVRVIKFKLWFLNKWAPYFILLVFIFSYFIFRKQWILRILWRMLSIIFILNINSTRNIVQVNNVCCILRIKVEWFKKKCCMKIYSLVLLKQVFSSDLFMPSYVS